MSRTSPPGFDVFLRLFQRTIPRLSDGGPVGVEGNVEAKNKIQKEQTDPFSGSMWFL